MCWVTGAFDLDHYGNDFILLLKNIKQQHYVPIIASDKM